MIEPQVADGAVASLGFMERVMVQHAHPVKLVCDSAGVVVCIFLMWRRQLPKALTVLFGSSFLGSVLVRTADTQELANTALGQWMLRQAQSTNLLVRTIGFAVLLRGAWRHSVVLIGAGTAAVIAARALSRRPAELDVRALKSSIT